MATTSKVSEHGGVHERDSLPPTSKGKREKSADIIASLEARLQWVEFVMADNRDKVEDMDQRIDGLEGGNEEFHREMQGILNSLAESWKAQIDALKDSLQAEIAAIKDCPQRAKLAALIRDDEEEPHQEKAKVGSLRLLNAIKAKVGKTKASRKGHGSKVKEAKRLGLQLKEEQGWIKAVNTETQPIYGVARDVRLHIGDWCGQVDFTVVPMDDYPIVLGMEFLDGGSIIEAKTLSAMQLSKEETSDKIPATILTKSLGAFKSAKGWHADMAKVAKRMKKWAGKNRQAKPLNPKSKDSKEDPWGRNNSCHGFSRRTTSTPRGEFLRQFVDKIAKLGETATRASPEWMGESPTKPTQMAQ
ncbi:hypothetical protein Acr_28g0008640 [Actinidia rufa]|uniref:Uncharacterized protein n=1 Tax=Actinidia rufa TaxID=165716 RepID=A0A7J0HAR3_9ERIC|nr:hypothetical protein Acr_28g0008640 [Actinidia rufa]